MVNRKLATILAGSAIIFLVGCTSFNIGENGSSEEGSSGQKVINKKNPLENLTAENITCVNIDSRTEDDSEEDIRIEIDFVEGTICSGKAYEFRDDNDELPEVKSLPDEHLTELRELVKDYSYTVQEQEKDYWPDLEEYPALLVLFEYEIEFGEDRYATDGALCYPDGWDEFVNQLLEYGSAQNGGETDEEDTGAFLSGTSYFNGYSIYLECPEPGYPSGGSMWSTDYVDEEKDIDVSVDIYALEGSLEEKKQELESSFEELEEGNLWGHECSYYITDYEYEFGTESVMADCLIVLIPLGDENYLQIDIKGFGMPLEDGKALLEDETFQSAFTMEIAEVVE